MTVVLAFKDRNNRMIVAADKMSTAGTTTINHNSVKIHKCKHFVIGMSGDAELNTDLEFGQLNLDHIKPTYKDLKTKLFPLIKRLVVSRRKEPPTNTDGYYHSDTTMLIVTKDEIREMDVFGDLNNHTARGYAAIGSGAPYVLGFLGGVQINVPGICDDDGPRSGLSYSDAQRAVEIASQFVNTISKECDIIPLR